MAVDSDRVLFVAAVDLPAKLPSGVLGACQCSGLPTFSPVHTPQYGHTCHTPTPRKLQDLAMHMNSGVQLEKNFSKRQIYPKELLESLRAAVD